MTLWYKHQAKKILSLVLKSQRGHPFPYTLPQTHAHRGLHGTLWGELPRASWMTGKDCLPEHQSDP